jgi:2-phospho-L-lactate guanylyltransferase
VLLPHERLGLVRAMAADVLATLTRQPDLARIVLCSNEPEAERVAWSWGVELRSEGETPAGGYAAAVNRAVASLAAEGAEEILVVPGDVPLLSPTELGQFLARHRVAGSRAVTLAPDRWREGTNLLAWRPLPAFTARFGPGSLARHSECAARLGFELTLCNLPGAGHDIDEPADLLELADTAPEAGAPQTRAFLAESGLIDKLLRWADWQEKEASRAARG